MSLQESSPQFVMGQPGENVPKTVQKVVAAEAYFVQYTDGDGKEQVRLVFKAPGSKSCFILKEKLGRESIITSGTQWFADALFQKLESGGDGEVQSV